MQVIDESDRYFGSNVPIASSTPVSVSNCSHMECLLLYHPSMLQTDVYNNLKAEGLIIT